MDFTFKQNYKPKFVKKLAFTLAEVLIVIGILGIVAEMTIPTIVSDVKKKVLESQFKTMYSTMSQALLYTKMDLNTENLYRTYTVYNGSDYPNAPEFYSAFYKRLKIVQDLNYTKTPRNYSNNADAYFQAIGTESPHKALPNGSTIQATVWSDNINISVDVNGPLKKPNRVGYDIFSFQVDHNRDILVPRDKDNGDMVAWFYICTKASNLVHNGLGCSYWAILDKNPDDPTKGYWDSLD